MIRNPQIERSFVTAHVSRSDRQEPYRAGAGIPCHPLDGLRGSGVADRFCAWAGRSGRRYIFSVVPLAAAGDPDDLPLAVGAVVLAAGRVVPGPRRALWVARVEDEGDLAAARAAIRGLAQSGGCEIHLHLLARGVAGRRAVVADLDVPRLEGMADR